MDTESLNNKTFIEKASKNIATKDIMDLFLMKARRALENVVLAYEGSNELTAAVYIGELKEALANIDDTWKVIVNE